MMNEVTHITISRAFSKAVRWQIILTVLIAGISLLLAGLSAAISAIAGGASVIVGGYAGMMMARRSSAETSGDILISLLKAEAIKVLVIAMLLLVTFKYYQGLAPLYLIGGLAVSALASGAGLRAIKNENKE